jgi:translin
MNNLESIAETIRSEFEAKNAARDDALARSRTLIRYCANTIRAIHRREWERAKAGLETVRAAGQELMAGVEEHPDLFYSGYTQDALKELAEVFVTYALVRGGPLPTPEELQIPAAAYLNGLAEAASELRRTILDIIRQDHNHEAEQLLEHMDAIYNALMAFDFPDAVTGGLRRRVDSLRGVLERTRGDLTNSLRQQRLRAAIQSLEKQLGVAVAELDDEAHEG